MCLILLSYKNHPDVEILLAGNRDEFHRRKAEPPRLLAGVPRIWAGRDLEAGGTWMGRNEHGVVAALTNRRSAAPSPPEPRSRGEIVMGLLRQRTATDAAAWLGTLPHERFRPYSVLFGSREAFYYFSPNDSPAEGHTSAPRLLRPGNYALSNSTLDDRSWPKVDRSQHFLQDRRGAGGEALLADLQRFLCDPTPADNQPTLIAGEEIHGAQGAVFIRSTGYGTVSSSILTLGGKLGDGYYYAESADMMRAADEAAAGRPFASPFRPIPLTVPQRTSAVL